MPSWSVLLNAAVAFVSMTVLLLVVLNNPPPDTDSRILLASLGVATIASFIGLAYVTEKQE
jgi:hypothetical protein